MAKKNELVKADAFNLMTISGDMAEAVAEEMDGLGALSFDRVKIPAGGGIAFELPGEDEDNPESSPAQPDCSSFDGKKGVFRGTGEIRDCAACPYNQFGSDGRGKACKNVHRLYILQEGNPVPIILALPPSYLKSLRDYIGKKILLKGLRCFQVITKITLKKEVNADNITYSRAVFTFQDTLSPEQQAAIEGMRGMVKATRLQVDVGLDDYSMDKAAASGSGSAAAADAPAAGPDGFMNIPEGDDAELPFN